MIPFGIHVGCTTTSLAIFQEGKTEIVPNDAGDRVTPACVAFNGKERTVGIAAKQGLIRNSSNTVCHVKSVLNDDKESVENYNSSHACKLALKNGNKLCFNMENNDVTPQDVLGAIFDKIIETAKSRCGQLNSYDAVISVPFHFDDDKKNLIQDVATKCGFNVLQIISEPAACLLAYNIGQEHPKHNGYSIVYRIGGRSLDVTAFYVNSGIYSVIGSVHRNDIGADQITDLLVKYLAEEFRKRYYIDVYESRRSVAKLTAAAENSKHILSSMSTAQCFVESLHEGVDFNCNVTRARFESILATFLPNLLNPVEEVLKKANLDRKDVQHVILSGGGAKTPKLYQSIKDLFCNAQVLNSIPPDEVIAIGSACQSALISKNNFNSNCVEMNCLSRGIYVKVLENEIQNFHSVFPLKTVLPSHVHKIFHLPPEQTSLCMEVWEGVEDKVLLGKVVLKNLPQNPEITANFHLKRDGSLHVTCSEKSSSLSSSITIGGS